MCGHYTVNIDKRAIEALRLASQRPTQFAPTTAPVIANAADDQELQSRSDRARIVGSPVEPVNVNTPSGRV